MKDHIVVLNIHCHPDSFPQDILASKQRTALNDLHQAFDALAKAKPDILADTSLTPQGRLLKVYKMYEKAVNPQRAKAFDTMVAAIPQRANVEAEMNDLLKPSTDPVAMTLAAEMRAVLRSLDPGMRGQLINEAIKAGDRETVSAAVNGHETLNGFPNDMRKEIRDEYLKANNPSAYERMMTANTIDKQAGNSAQALDPDKFIASIFSHDELQELTGIVKLRERADSHTEQVKPLKM